MDDESVEVVCSGDAWVAFIPDNPATPGHVLVIPRIHRPDLWSLDDTTAAALMSATIRVGNAISRAVMPTPEGMNLISSAGSAAEQSVFHVHLHVVPRWSSDRIGQIWPPKRPMSERLEADLASRIRYECNLTETPTAWQAGARHPSQRS
jgi:histidine triad (HIT) family protein